jgi:hypothetical protein
MCGLPDTILEIAEYLKEHGELPFKYDGTNWVYDAFVECQKYRGVKNSQYLTPDATVDRMLHFTGKYFHPKNDFVLEPFCGTGQITKELLKCDYSVEAFDNDKEMVNICSYLYAEFEPAYKLCLYHTDFRNHNTGGRTNRNQIICNPPYEITELTEFLEWIDRIQDYGGLSVLLLPKGFIDKDKPKRTFQALRKFGVLEREDMIEEFARTKVRTEIVVLKKL